MKILFRHTKNGMNKMTSKTVFNWTNIVEITQCIPIDYHELLILPIKLELTSRDEHLLVVNIYLFALDKCQMLLLTIQ